MSSTGLNGPVKSISSVREDNGSNTDDVLELGRMLTAHLADHDTVGRWMAHHLATLIVAAQDDATTTVEQRLQIVDTILKAWNHRHYYPVSAPLKEFSNVLEALDRLGDSSPWKFSRLFDTDPEMPKPGTTSPPLVATASELECLTRETLIRLIWLAAQDARDANHDWLEAADKVASNLESEVTTTLWRLRRRIARHRINAVEDDPQYFAETATEAPTGVVNAARETQSTTEDLTDGATAEDIVESGFENHNDVPRNDEGDDENNPLSNINHVKRLRDMATLLNKVADALTAPSSSD